jgi:hypothetical protein
VTNSHPASAGLSPTRKNPATQISPQTFAKIPLIVASSSNLLPQSVELLL